MPSDFLNEVGKQAKGKGITLESVPFGEDMMKVCERMMQEALVRTDLKFEKIDSPEGSIAYQATAKDFHVMAIGFDIENQGFPKGTLGYDGVISQGTTITRTTRFVAEMLFKKAKSQETT